MLNTVSLNKGFPLLFSFFPLLLLIMRCAESKYANIHLAILTSAIRAFQDVTQMTD